MSNRTLIAKLLGAAMFALLAGAGCAHAPDTPTETRAMQTEADAALDTMTAKDPSLNELLASSAGYVIFPSVGKGGAIVGGAHGVGVVYENGRPIGHAELSQASVGLQLGGETFSELIVLKDRGALERLKAGDFDLTANASAVALESGAGAGADVQNGTVVFIDSTGGLMAGVDVGGQKIKFEENPGSQ